MAIKFNTRVATFDQKGLQSRPAKEKAGDLLQRFGISKTKPPVYETSVQYKGSGAVADVLLFWQEGLTSSNYNIRLYENVSRKIAEIVEELARVPFAEIPHDEIYGAKFPERTETQDPHEPPKLLTRRLDSDKLRAVWQRLQLNKIPFELFKSLFDETISENHPNCIAPILQPHDPLVQNFDFGLPAVGLAAPHGVIKLQQKLLSREIRLRESIFSLSPSQRRFSPETPDDGYVADGPDGPIPDPHHPPMYGGPTRGNVEGLEWVKDPEKDPSNK